MTSFVETKNGTKEVSPNKYCPKCEKFKPTLDSFALYADTSDGFARHCKDCEKNRKKQRSAAAREMAIEIYGGECAACGLPDLPGNPLEFDHVNNDGKDHRKKQNADTMLSRIAMTGQKHSEYELQLLCKSCHRIKTEEDFPGFLDWLYEQHRQKKVLANANS